jgi:UTP--glucose-1-phosphate uridylyltransferase
MNSFRTDEETRHALRDYPALTADLPTTFVQHRFPRVRIEDLAPAESPHDTELEWSPPGHGDLYPALVTSGLLPRLRERGYRYAFITNIDNLGAAFDLGLLGYLARERLHFLMEVAERTLRDRKGGHLARLADGRLLLREIAQCPEEDRDHFQDVERHRLFNTNNLWVDLQALERELEAHGGVLPLPLIRNRKRLDPRHQTGPEVYQLESAVGAAISAFERAAAVRVPRSRFTPVKSCDDLLLIRSDRYTLTEDFVLARSPEARTRHVRVDLDPAFYGRLDQLEARFPYGSPSLVECQTFTVRGDVLFGGGVIARGRVTIQQREGAPQARIPDGAVLEGSIDL